MTTGRSVTSDSSHGLVRHIRFAEVEDFDRAENTKNNNKKFNQSRPTLEIYRPPGRRSTQSDVISDDQHSNAVYVTTRPKFDQMPPGVAGSKQHPYHTRSRTAPFNLEDKDINTFIRAPPAPIMVKPSRAPDTFIQPTQQTTLRRFVSIGNLEPPLVQNLQRDGISASMNTLTSMKISEINFGLSELQLTMHPVVQQFLADNYENRELANQTAQLVVHKVIEQAKQGKTATKLCIAIAGSSVCETFYTGLETALQQYLDCRDMLRSEHFWYWINFLNFVADLCAASEFTSRGESARILFESYEYLLTDALDTVKIEELETVISCLVNNGHMLEREFPSDLAALQNTLRNACMYASEPWARKMLLLLVELSASGWKLPQHANEYYFQTVAAR